MATGMRAPASLKKKSGIAFIDQRRSSGIFAYAPTVPVSQDHDQYSVADCGMSSSVRPQPQTLTSALDAETIDPETWRSINLLAWKADEEICEVVLLRPLWWIRRCDAKVGSLIRLDMPEMGVVGAAKVLSIGPCLKIADKGKGFERITGTFKHRSKLLLHLYLDDTAGQIRVTPNHPFYSLDRGGFIAAGQLRVGERLETDRKIAARVAKVDAISGEQAVYNIEVHRSHTYYVSSRKGDKGILVHNNCPGEVGTPPSVSSPAPTPPVSKPATPSQDLMVPICFAAGTQLLLADGTRKVIEQIREKEEVFAVNESQPEGALHSRRVQEVYHHNPQPLLAVTVEKQKIRCTFAHPFYVKGKGWVAAESLLPGDELRTRRSKWVKVETVADTGVVEPVYNIRVENDHTYFVCLGDSDTAILVHNESAITGPTTQPVTQPTSRPTTQPVTQPTSRPTTRPSGMTLSAEGEGLIKYFEKLRLQPYSDQTRKPISAWTQGATVGWGHLISKPDWAKFKNGLTTAQADALFRQDVQAAIDAVRRNIKVDISQQQFDALVSLAYNIGVDNFAKSSVVKLTNDPQANTPYGSLDEAWMAWNKSQGKVMQGLINRRMAELGSFLEPQQ